MAPSLLTLEEAANFLGISPDQLSELRSQRKIAAVNAGGGAWKFKTQELERYAEEEGLNLGGEGDATVGVDDDDLSALLADDDDDEGDLASSSILVSEEELGRPEGTSSTVIGKTIGSDEDSDIRLAPDSAGQGSDLRLAEDSSADEATTKPSDSDLVLSGDSGVDLAGSDLKLAQDAGSDLTEESSVLLADENGAGGEGDTNRAATSGEDDEYALASEEGDVLGDDMGGSKKGGSSNIELGPDDDDDFVLSGSDVDVDLAGGGSDVMLAGDSGVGIAHPSESGLSLEADEMMDLGGLDMDDDDSSSDDVIALEEDLADPDAATQLKADNDFLLTPAEEVIDEESDSGSQVIALDTEDYEGEDPTQLGMDDGPILEETSAEGDAAAALLQPSTGPAAMVQRPQPGVHEPPDINNVQVLERPYSVWQVLSLSIVALMVGVSGMLMTDLVRNIWSFDKPYSATSSLMDSIVQMLGI